MRSISLFKITRNGLPIQDVPLKYTLNTGIDYDTLPFCLPTFVEVSACVDSNYRYWHDWQELDADQQAFLIAYYLSKKSVDSHAHDAQAKHQEQASKRKK